ncbi:TetR/AcrR family transcriptional regulator [Sulfitobacter donghicola]|uniref:TetR family transcriptional regulator n=1 Tax=Sulfitobacter donghicola DSW-25 = KCTC 12864 = JCM 14565 TaxID=1300350 RepID=A0A073IHI1_9RHOB|nr:TetR/AcrR family transcriptional regulator [Sulfitobacter donghicola]KEJ88961.1 TetR family transcriptional regulator [Sulfitobacter donghicola DSW-25 = KCTC 12864 = JCM 14565]KIN67490.1 Transcriptional regulator, TetR family [Sulfitobacter donghicola DSW-25 = KCTC 12864 = JCM 14565]
MKNTAVPKNRATRETWIEAAYSIVVKDGFDALKIMPLAKSLNLTRTGFYWHFKNLTELQNAIIEIWQTRNTGIIVERCNTPSASLCAGLFNLIDCWIDRDLFDAPLDLAVRNWARSDQQLQGMVDQADETRLLAVKALFERFGRTGDVAHYRALTVILTQTGYYSMHVSEPRLQRAIAGCEYAEIFAGERPTQAEKEAFLDRYR